MSRLLKCWRCGAGSRFFTDGRGNLCESVTVCRCPPVAPKKVRAKPVAVLNGEYGICAGAGGVPCTARVRAVNALRCADCSREHNRIDCRERAKRRARGEKPKPRKPRSGKHPPKRVTTCAVCTKKMATSKPVGVDVMCAACARPEITAQRRCKCGGCGLKMRTKLPRERVAYCRECVRQIGLERGAA